MSTDPVTDGTLKAVFVDPDDHGFYTSRAKQWATLCPHMNSTEHRVYALMLDLCSERNDFRKLTLAEIAAIMPAGKVALGESAKSISISTIASAINALAAIGQVTDHEGQPLRVSNKTKGEIRIAPHRSLRHDCTASRNVRDALARTRGTTGDDGPRHPTGLGLAQDSVPPADVAQDSVPAAQDSVPPAQDAVPVLFETPETTSENTMPVETPFSSSSRNSTHTPAREQTPTDDEVDADTGVCVVDSEDEKAIVDVLKLNLVTRAPASKQNDDDDAKKTIVLKAKMCFNAGATIEEIDAVLSAKIDTDTRYPINIGTKALRSLLARKQGKPDPFGAAEPTPEPVTDALVDSRGRTWPRTSITDRPCRGGSCHDISGKRYVSIISPTLGAFSCPICEPMFEKEGRLT